MVQALCRQVQLVENVFMTAKERKVALNVRLPASLKSRLEKAASKRRSSVTREVERLLKQAISEASSNVDQQAQPPEQKAQEMTARTLEDWVLTCCQIADPGERAAAVAAMGQEIVVLRERKNLLKQDIDRGRAQAAKQADEGEQPGELYAQLRPDLREKGIPRQLGKYAQRRLVLNEIFRAAPRGSKTQLADFLGCRPPYVTHLRTGRRRISSEIASRIEEFYFLPCGLMSEPETSTQVAELLAAADELESVLRDLVRDHPVAS